MTLTIIQLNNLEILSKVNTSDADGLQFYCHDKKTELSYSECLSLNQLKQRIRELNKRVHFPLKAVRTALSSCSPIDASMSISKLEPVKLEEEQEQEQKGQNVLNLKYRIEGAPAPMKWEWHLSVLDNALFYRSLLQDALYAASYLNKNLHSLLDVVKKKDVELNQYRLEGAQLRRTTVATEPFDVPAFQMQHEEILTDVEGYGQVKELLSDSSNIKNEIEAEAEPLKPTDVATTNPGNVSSKLISPRARKRKAMESGKQHVERKVLQRRLVPQLQYKNTESQEDDLEAELSKNVAAVKSEEDVKSEDDDMAEIELKVEPDEDTFLSSLQS